MSRLVLRADASPGMGTGHVLRCLALAHAARDAGWTPLFVAAELPPGVESRLVREGMPVARLPQGVVAGSGADLAWVDALAADAYVVDGYHFGPAYQRGLRAPARRTLVVDDTAHLERYEADVLLNHSLISPEAYAGKTDARLVLGPRYALLRPGFAASSDLAATPTRASRVLVTMGGADPPDATALVVRALAEPCLGDIDATVVVGPANARGAALRALAAGLAGERIRVVGPLDDLAACMREADFAIAAAGGTTWELCAMAVPTVLLAIADNQRAFARDVSVRGAAWFAGDVEALRPDHLARYVADRLADGAGRAAMRRAANALVDGGGAARALAVLVGSG